MLFVHISDIHFRASQIGQPDDPNKALRSDFIHDVKIMRERIGKAANGILLTGDIAFAGKSSEYDFAYTWLKEQLCPAAGCELSDVFVIPGNHDVDRDAASAPAQRSAREALRALSLEKLDGEIAAYMRDGYSSKVIFGPIENYNRFAAKFLCLLGPYVEEADREPTRPFAVRNLRLNDNSILRLWGFNSVLVSNLLDDEKNMIVDPAAALIEKEDGVANVVMCHHPFSWLKNGGAFQDRIDAVAHIHLFGHEHTRRVESNADFVRIRAGAVQPDRDGPEWKPGYNWIDISVEGTKDNRTLAVDVWVRMYENRPPQFLSVKDKWGNDPWPTKVKLEPWHPKAEVADSWSEIRADVLDQTVDPKKPPEIDVRNVALKIMALRVDELEKLMQSLDLDEIGDRNLKDYELGIAAIRRAVERSKLSELNDALNRAG